MHAMHWAAPAVSHMHAHLVMCLFTRLLLEWFCFRFCFFWPSLVFQHMVGSLGNSGFVHFFLLFLCLRISEFSLFSEILILVGLCSVLSVGFADNHLHSWTIPPVTSSSFQPTTHHTSHQTTPYHLTTAPYYLFTHDLTPDPAVDMGSQHTHGPQTRGR